MEAGRAEAGGRPRREQGRAGGSLTGLGRARELPLRVVAVPVLGRRRLGLLARSPRRGSDAPALRCPPPAAAPGDGLPRRRRLRGRTVAQGVPAVAAALAALGLAAAVALRLGTAFASEVSSAFARLLKTRSLSGRAAPGAPRPAPARARL